VIEMTQPETRDDYAPEATGVDKPFGPVAAAFLAAGIAAVVLGVLTVLAEASESVKSSLEWSKSVGPLMGKTILTVVAFAVSWLILHVVFRDKDVDPRTVFTWTAVLVAIGLVLTFPPFFQLFAAEE
jgi:hypothetical protein